MIGTLTLAAMLQDKSYRVVGFHNDATDYAEKLLKMGFVTGTPVALAPTGLKDPLVVSIRGSRIALRKAEAQEILVEES